MQHSTPVTHVEVAVESDEDARLLAPEGKPGGTVRSVLDSSIRYAVVCQLAKATLAP